MKFRFLFLLLTAAGSIARVSAAPQITTAAGASPGAIQAAVDAFRAKLGANNAGNPGPFTSGFRNLNWDGVPDSAAHPNPTPAAFFNSTTPRGAVFNTPGVAVISSAKAGNPSNLAPRFASIDPSYASAFQVFSPERLFTPLDSTIVDATFFVPSSSGTMAGVSGFGAVFCDVDLPASATIECFRSDGVSLGKFAAPAFDNGLSFAVVRWRVFRRG
jgi:hypothetical protein